jgi:16S rRNA (guanine527-N7)-methyltransferase
VSRSEDEAHGTGTGPGDMTLLAEGAAAMGLALTAAQLAQFERYLALLLDWNERLNLTAIRDPAAIQQRHFLDSLSCAAVMGDLKNRKVVDVGAGAGFPGLPLKILVPDMALTLVESTAKKGRFLAAAVEELNLDGVEIVLDRAENIGHLPGHREAYDWVLARAVAPLPTLVEYLLPLCVIGGRILAQKGPKAEEEIGQAAWAIRQLGGRRANLHQAAVPGLDETRILVVIEKLTPSPEEYPRRPGVPAKTPLLGP